MKKIYDVIVSRHTKHSFEYNGTNKKLAARLDDWKNNEYSKEIVVTGNMHEMVEFMSNTTVNGKKVSEETFKHVFGEDYGEEEKDGTAGTQG